jgi:hypothetical protein
MRNLDYVINPVLMNGLVKEKGSDYVKVHLHGRLGVITVPESLIIKTMELEPGVELQFYFSYIQVNEEPYDYDDSTVKDLIFEPCFVGGKIIEVNDTAIKVESMNHIGTVAVPRRWAFTDVSLEEGQNVEYYFSPMKTVGKREIPAESI